MNPYTIQPVPTDIMILMAQRLRHLRKQAKFSQVELAGRSNVSLGSLKRFEHTGKISLESLLRLAHVLGKLNDFTRVLKPDEDLSRIAKLFDK